MRKMMLKMMMVAMKRAWLVSVDDEGDEKNEVDDEDDVNVEDENDEVDEMGSVQRMRISSM